MQMRETENFKGLRGDLRNGEPMARYVTWRTGGTADRFYIPADLDDLASFLKQLAPDEPLLFVGLGSNLLVRDGGFRGTAVLMHSAARRPVLDGGLIHAEAGVASPKVARFAALHDFSGAEFLAGIPGTVGGALAMNAGCYGGETWDIVERVLTIDRSGTQRVRRPDEFAIRYRHCALKAANEEWFAAAWFKLPPGDGAASRERMKDFLARRVATQPLQLPNAGSVFRNPAGDHAARLIEACGLKGFARGGARVSEKHANFIVNPKGAARASDIEWLIDAVRTTVRNRTGVDLQPEVRIVGEAR